MAGIRDFRDKVVVITGAGSGIGRATALAFAREGARLVVADIRGDRVAETAAEIGQLGAEAHPHQVDVSNKADMERFANEVIATCGHVDILYNNAGVGLGGAVADSNLDDWEWLVGVNFWGVVYGMRFFVPHMIERRYGHIVSTASTAGLAASPGLGAYSASKFAVVGLSEALRLELRDHNIGVTSICPGIISTEIALDGRIVVPESEEVKDRMAASLKKYGRSPDKVARAVMSGVRRNRPIVPVGWEAWLAWLTMRASVRAHERLIHFLAKKLIPLE